MHGINIKEKSLFQHGILHQLIPQPSHRTSGTTRLTNKYRATTLSGRNFVRITGAAGDKDRVLCLTQSHNMSDRRSGGSTQRVQNWSSAVFAQQDSNLTPISRKQTRNQSWLESCYFTSRNKNEISRSETTFCSTIPTSSNSGQQSLDASNGIHKKYSVNYIWVFNTVHWEPRQNSRYSDYAMGWAIN